MGRKTALSFILLMILSLLLMANSGSAQEQAPVYTTPLGIALDEYPYPYPVQFLSLGTALRSIPSIIILAPLVT